MEIGKASTAYSAYLDSVPKTARKRQHPTTPDPYDARMSKRQYEGRIRAWKRSVHGLAAPSPLLDARMTFFLHPSEVGQLFESSIGHVSYVNIEPTHNEAEEDWTSLHSAAPGGGLRVS